MGHHIIILNIASIYAKLRCLGIAFWIYISNIFAVSQWCIATYFHELVVATYVFWPICLDLSWNQCNMHNMRCMFYMNYVLLIQLFQMWTRTTRTPAFWGYPPAASWLPTLLGHIGSQVKKIIDLELKTLQSGHDFQSQGRMTLKI